MSLTGHLKHPASPITQFIRQRFLHTSAITKLTNSLLRNSNTIMPAAHPWPYSTIGTAIDYRIRYNFAATPSQHFVAWHGASSLMMKPRENDNDIPFDWSEIPLGKSIFMFGSYDPGMEIAEGPYPPKLVIDFFESLDVAIDTIKPVGRRLELEEEQVLARYCFVLALFEEVFREGLDGRAKDGPLMLPSPKKNLEELLAIPEDSWIDDLCALSWLFYDKCSHILSQPVILNPTFDGSGDVGGADADFIVNGCLLEIKTTKQQKIDPDWLRQIIGYILLDYNDEYHINSVGIYMARQGIVLTWTLADFLYKLTGNNTTSVTELRQEFRTICKQRQRRVLTSH